MLRECEDDVCADGWTCIAHRAIGGRWGRCDVCGTSAKTKNIIRPDQARLERTDGRPQCWS
eukprot:scaffold421244_cov58-Attheya_sp.AAC.2